MVIRVIIIVTTISIIVVDVQGPIHAAATIVREEGLKGLWSGAAPTVMRNGTNQARPHLRHYKTKRAKRAKRAI
jgi:hypothetical protein